MKEYKIDFAISATVSASVVKEMVRKVVEEQTGRTVTNIDMKVGTVSRGFGPSETTEHVFEGCTVYFAPENNAKSKSGFAQDNYTPR